MSVVYMLEEKKKTLLHFLVVRGKIDIPITLRLTTGLTFFCTNFTKIGIPWNHRSPSIPSVMSLLNFVIVFVLSVIINTHKLRKDEVVQQTLPRFPRRLGEGNRRTDVQRIRGDNRRTDLSCDLLFIMNRRTDLNGSKRTSVVTTDGCCVRTTCDSRYILDYPSPPSSFPPFPSFSHFFLIPVRASSGSNRPIVEGHAHF